MGSKRMKADPLIKELNRLWEPVRPFLVTQVEELYDRRDGPILEIGPFSGLIFALAEKFCHLPEAFLKKEKTIHT